MRGEPPAVQKVRDLLLTGKFTRRELMKALDYTSTPVWQALRDLDPQKEHVDVGACRWAYRYWLDA